MEIRHFILLASLCTWCVALGMPQVVNTESVDAIKKEMNRIKTDEAYISAEATCEGEKEAYNMALADVFSSINRERMQQGKQTLDIESVRPYAHSISIKRGSMQRVLVYIVWADIEGGSSGTDKVGSDEDIDSDVIIVINTQSPSGTDKKEPSPQDVESKTGPTPNPFNGTTYSGPIGEVLASLCMTEMVEDALLQLAAFKVEQKISDYGPCNINFQLTGNTFLLFFDQTRRTISSILEVRDDGFIYNVKTHEFDDIDNYNNCRAFWFNE